MLEIRNQDNPVEYYQFVVCYVIDFLNLEVRMINILYAIVDPHWLEGKKSLKKKKILARKYENEHAVDSMLILL